MRKQILLIAPYIHDFAAYDLWLKPLGLLYIAAAAEMAGHEVRVVNCIDRLHPSNVSYPPAHRSRTEDGGKGKLGYEVIPKPECIEQVPREYKRYGIPTETFRDQLLEGPRPDVVGVGSMMTYWCGGVAETVSIVREYWPDVRIVLGGVYATICSPHARAHAGADIVIEGPGELQFLRAIEDDIAAVDVEAISPGRLLPAYHLLRHLDSVSMLTSFGCPFSCAYCASKLLRSRFHQRPAGEVIEEIAHYAGRMGISDIAFYDDALLMNPERHIKPILRGIIERELCVRLHAPNGLHANMLDGELADLMKQAGFTTIRLSVESVDETLLRDSCSKVTPAGFQKALEHLFTAGYEVGDVEAYVLMGVPGQSSEVVECTMELVHSAGAIVRLADFSPIPGTAYFDATVEAYGIDPSEPLLQNSSVLPHIVPGLLEQYQRLKEEARSLNIDLTPRARRLGRIWPHSQQ